MEFLLNNTVSEKNNMIRFVIYRSVYSFIWLSKQPAEYTFTRTAATNYGYTAEFTRTKRSASCDPPYPTRRCPNSSSDSSFRFRSNHDRCTSGAECYEGIRGTGTKRYYRTANSSRDPSESRSRTGTFCLMYIPRN